MSLGGLDTEWPKEKNVIDEFAAENIRNTTKILFRGKSTGSEKLVRTMEFLGYKCSESEAEITDI